jgi:hypothetical protein
MSGISRSMTIGDMLEWFARECGIADHDIAEAAWLGNWMKRHHNCLRYDELTCRWFWSAV